MLNLVFIFPSFNGFEILNIIKYILLYVGRYTNIWDPGVIATINQSDTIFNKLSYFEFWKASKNLLSK